MCTDDVEILREQHELICKAARRCMYDLKHCIEALGEENSDRYDLYSSRFKNWELIFEAATGAKDYRHDLHRHMASQEWKIRKLKKLLEDNGIAIPEEDPF